jgi:CSLREA domain-containing protein
MRIPCTRPCVLAVLLAASVADAGAATFTVTSAADLVDVNPGDGTCATSSGSCTLRAAIMESNATPSADTIALAGGTHVLSIAGIDEDAAATGDLDIVAPVSILSPAGVPTTVDANGIDRVFDIRTSATSVVFSGLVVRGGTATTAQSAWGGGIASTASTLFQCEYCIVEDNDANTGGGIYAVGGEVRLLFSVVRHNRALDVGATNPEGAGIRRVGGPLRIERSAVYENTTSVTGFSSKAAISSNNADLAVFSSTISDNTIAGIDGGNGNVVLQNVTLASNGEAGLRWFDGSAANSYAVFVRNSAISGHADGDCLLVLDSAALADVDGHNLDSDGSCGLSAAPAFGNFPHTDPGLGPLDTSLALPARVPNPGSVLVDHGSPAVQGTGDPDACFPLDQAGNPRMLDGDGDGAGRCDIGAIERRFVDLVFADGFD